MAISAATAPWHDRIRAGLEAAGAAARIRPRPRPAPHGGGGPKQRRNRTQHQTPRPAPRSAVRAPTRRPRSRAAKPLSPSDLGGPSALPGETGLDETAAKRRGRQVHRLLEILPPLPARGLAPPPPALLLQRPRCRAGEETALLLAEAEKVLTRPSLAPSFTGDALAEVPITATLDPLGGRRIHGVIDRLIVAPDRVLAVDFKTNTTLPDRAETAPRRSCGRWGPMPTRWRRSTPTAQVETALFWTRTATLMPLPHALVSAALAAGGIA